LGPRRRKKLTEAAELWARGGFEQPDTAQLRESMERLGAPSEAIAQWLTNLEQQHRDKKFSVWPEHWYAMQLFCAMQTQWQVLISPSGQWHHIGLRRETLPVHLAAFKNHPHRCALPVLLPQLHTLELAARATLNR
jgi:Phage related hypothetical protein (DUF1799)